MPYSIQIQKILRSPYTFSVASALAWQGFGLLTFMALARLLSVSEMGVWAIWISLLTIADMPRQGFTQNGLVKYTAAEPEAWGKWLSAGLLLNSLAALVLGLLLAAALYLGAALLEMPDLRSLAPFALPFMLLQSLTRYGEAAQIARSDFRVMFFANVLNAGLQFLAVGLLLWTGTHPSFPQLLAVQALGVSVGCVFTYFVGKRHFQFGPLERGRIESLFHFGKFVAGTNFVSLLFQRLDTLLVGTFLTPAAVGIYNTATRLNGLLDLPLNSLSMAQSPVLAKASATPGQIQSVARKCALQLALVQVPASVLLIILAPYAITLLVGEKYLEAAPLLQILAVTGLVKPWTRTFGMTLDAMGRPGLNFGMLLFSIAFNLLLLLFFVPWLGAMGAALAMGLGIVISTGAGQLLMRRFFKKTQNIQDGNPSSISLQPN
ncbi:MAG: oligosaccharide flippase family protein [Saprospiraceae bacterium]|nr:oligosaccharide flippase family protein [Saprospiraceae bacterium]